MITIDNQKCIGCGKCAKDCIALAIQIMDGTAVPPKDCLLCGHCVAICPTNAVSIPDYDMNDIIEYDPDTFSLSPETLLNSIKFRRSIRDYKAQPIEDEKRDLILQAGRYTATAKNNQDCHFIFVQDELETLKKYVWDYIDSVEATGARQIPKEFLPFVNFNRRRKKNPNDDYLFRNAPAVLFITSDWPLDAGLSAQNMELMAVASGLGALYNGYLARIANENEALKDWLGISDKTIKACMLLGYPNVKYERTAPRRKANIILK